MTNEIIQAIREEIARLQPNAPKPGNMKSVDAKVAMQVHARLNKLLSFLFDFEKSLPTKVADSKELENEVVSYCFDNGLNLSPRVATDFAHHFYELGCTRTAEKYDELEYNRQRAEESVPKDIEEASSKFATHTASNGVSVEFLEEKLSFQEGAKWDREQIMKNAKDGWMDEEDVIVLNDGTRIDLQPDYEKKPAFEFKYAQDVRVIILPKEDEK